MPSRGLIENMAILFSTTFLIRDGQTFRCAVEVGHNLDLGFSLHFEEAENPSFELGQGRGVNLMVRGWNAPRGSAMPPLLVTEHEGQGIFAQVASHRAGDFHLVHFSVLSGRPARQS